MNVFHGALSHSLNCFIINLCLPSLAHGLISLPDDLKTCTDGLSSSLSDQKALIS